MAVSTGTEQSFSGAITDSGTPQTLYVSATSVLMFIRTGATDISTIVLHAEQPLQLLSAIREAGLQTESEAARTCSFGTQESAAKIDMAKGRDVYWPFSGLVYRTEWDAYLDRPGVGIAYHDGTNTELFSGREKNTFCFETSDYAAFVTAALDACISGAAKDSVNEIAIAKHYRDKEIEWGL